MVDRGTRQRGARAGCGRRRAAAIGAALLAAACAPSAAACGEETACGVDGGTYRIAAPQGWDGRAPLPTLVFFHGHRGSGAGVMKGGTRKAFNAAGWLVIAPDGAVVPGRTWRAWPARETGGAWRDDVAFTEAVIADAAGRFPIDRDRLVISGFSAGGSMAWRIACRLGGDAAAAYAPVAGALRRPPAQPDCAGPPAPLLHTHGFVDAQVPLEGRAIRDWHQGDVFASLDAARRRNGCPTKPDGLAADPPYWARDWIACAGGARIGLRLHDGGHGVPAGWAAVALDWLGETLAPPAAATRN